MYRDQVDTNNGFRTVPTAAERGRRLQLAPDRNADWYRSSWPADYERRDYDPATTRTVDGQVVEILPEQPGSDEPVRSVASKILALVPNPVNNAAVNNYPVIFPANKFQWIPSIKIDHALTNSIHLSGYYALTATDKDNGGDGLPDPISARRYQVIRSNTVRINMDDAIRPTLVLHAGVGFQRYHRPGQLRLPTSISQARSVCPARWSADFPSSPELHRSTE